MHNGYRMIGEFTVRPAVKNDFAAIGDDLIHTGEGDVSRYSDSPLALINSFAFLRNKEICGLGGYIIKWPGVAEAWSIWKRETGLKHKKSMILTAKILNDEFVTENNIWRLQAMRQATISDTWFEHMGFVKESTHKHYDLTGSDVDVYCRVYNNHLPIRN